MKIIILFVLRTYKRFVSPLFIMLFGNACRFTPTCSEYAIDAINKKGIKKGTIMAVKRLTRCNPLFKPGFDPVT
jgi:uncharacterized protein